MAFEEMDHEILVSFAAELSNSMKLLRRNVEQLTRSKEFSGQYTLFGDEIYNHYGNAIVLGFNSLGAFAKTYKTLGPLCSQHNEPQARTEVVDILTQSRVLLDSFIERTLGSTTEIPASDEALMEKAKAAKEIPLEFFAKIDNAFKELDERCVSVQKILSARQEEIDRKKKLKVKSKTFGG